MKYRVILQSGVGSVDIPLGQCPRHFLIDKFGKRRVLAYESLEQPKEEQLLRKKKIHRKQEAANGK